ncbi:MAG: gamma-glutamyltransferase [Alphaproteobacteria bacterium]|nr:gamma-glutamyltransferase [Alphaproteobacteria bacterium]
MNANAAGRIGSDRIIAEIMIPIRVPIVAPIVAMMIFMGFLVMWTLPVHAQRARIAPEAGSGLYAKVPGRARNYMVAAANPIAVEAGLEMLREGGSAADAAIATQLVLNLVEPQSSGIGGGAFVLHWHNDTRALTTYDGRETAPAAAKPDRFLQNGRRLPFARAVKSGLSVGVPGLVRLLAKIHAEHGRLPWKTLFQPAIRLAEGGFPVSPRLNFLLTWAARPADFAPQARAYFYDKNGTARPAGYFLRNPQFAETLRRIASEGADAFYRGDIASAIVRAVAEADGYAGDLDPDDLAAYAVKQREPLCIDYRDNRICGMGPPSSGAVTVAQILKLAEPFDIAGTPRRPMNTHALHILGEAGRLAYADRNRYVGDPDFVAVPARGMLDQSYLASRSRLIDPARAAATVRPGVPPLAALDDFGHDDTRESVGTSHISVVDGKGNAVSMTTTIESAFGSGLWAAGFLLNNELTDFSFYPVDGFGRPVANRVEAGKRPRSSMAPTMVFNADGTFRAALGSPGGSRIILYVTKALVAMIDWRLGPQPAAALMNFGSRGVGFEIEYDPLLATTEVLAPWSTVPSVWRGIRLRALGHRLRPDLMTSGLHIIERRDGILLGGADPRREGVARGN